MTAYYNDNDPFAAQWLRNLIACGLIAPGDVDDRSIKDVQPADLRGYAQVHLFAGIAGWSLALRTAGWPDDRPVWTGSCPCQPFSVAGKRAGFDDDRHLWPHMRELIRECGPNVVFGEQVAGASDWLNLVRGDLEALGYAVGAIPMEAASAGADHFRDRYWFVADVPGERRHGGGAPAEPYRRPVVEEHGSGPMVNPEGDGWGPRWTEAEFRRRGFTAPVANIGDRQYIECPDGKWRRIPGPGVRWLVNGLPSRVAMLRAFGNAIDPRPAAAFIQAYRSV